VTLGAGAPVAPPGWEAAATEFVRLVDRSGGAGSVTLTMEEGCRELVLYAPAEQPSVALEPLSCAHSAISRPAGASDVLAGRPPGERLRLAVTIAVGPGEGED
jgi:galactose mutarotase-like enzyme